MATIRIHAGAHKTATSALQNILEQVVVDQHLVTPRSYRGSNFDSKWIQSSSADLTSCFVEEFVKSDNVIISEERLLGIPLSNGRMYSKSEKFEVLVKDLVSLGHNVKVMITCREMFDFLRSWYMQVVFAGNTHLDFLDFISSSSLSRFSWEDVIGTLPSNCELTVLPYELLKLDSHKYCSILNEFFGFGDSLITPKHFNKKTNPSLDLDGYNIMRASSDLPRDVREKLGKLVKAKFNSSKKPKVISPTLQNLLKKGFAQDNHSFIDHYIHNSEIKKIWGCHV